MKFVKMKNPIPNRYIVLLNDDVVANKSSLDTRRAAVTKIASRHAIAYRGKVDYIYETALKGYAIELPDEAAAITLSQERQVNWVEEDGQFEYAQDQIQIQPEAFQNTPPWGLDAIDGTIPAPAPDANGRTNGIYIYNSTGAGVNAYVLDSGINTAHTEFTTGFSSRASQAANCIVFTNCQSGQMTPFFNQDQCVFPMPNSTNNDCHGHGTHVAGTLGGTNYGVAKSVSIKSVKIGTSNGVILSAFLAGVNWVTSDHLANPGTPAVANASVQLPTGMGVETAVSNSIALGVTYVAAAGNNNTNAANISPANVAAALTVGAVDWTGTRPSFSNWGPSVDLFAPGVFTLSALTGNFMPCIWNGTNSTFCQFVNGTSQASPHVAGAVAMYLQGRPGTTSCAQFPKQGVAPAAGNLSSCPDRVTQFINANSNLSKLTNINGTLPSANRFLWTAFIPTTTNPIDNQRFFVWQHYADFLAGQPTPDEGGLNFWTGNITNPCGTGFNDNNSCTQAKRIDVSRAFWVASRGSLFNANGTTNNSQFVHLCYEIYLRRAVSDNDPGFQFWLNDLTNNYGNPANYNGVNHLIDAFLGSADYRRRFGP
jgi:subtilisin family serine protease